MKDVAIYGAGGFGRETALMLNQINELKPTWNLLGFYDDGKAKDNIVDGLHILGGVNEVNDVRHGLSLVVAVADPLVRKKIVAVLINPLLDFPVVIHPDAMTGDKQRNRFGRGTIITAGNILTTNIHTGEFVIVNLSNTIGHDVTIGSYTTIMPGSHISGNVKIGECSFIGTGASILQNLALGERCKVGAGAVVIDDVHEGEMVVGVPAKSKSNVKGV